MKISFKKTILLVLLANIIQLQGISVASIELRRAAAIVGGASTFYVLFRTPSDKKDSYTGKETSNPVVKGLDWCTRSGNQFLTWTNTHKDKLFAAATVTALIDSIGRKDKDGIPLCLVNSFRATLGYLIMKSQNFTWIDTGKLTKS